MQKDHRGQEHLQHSQGLQEQSPAPGADQTEELDFIRRELSKIKAQVDRLLESLESMEQQRDQHMGQVKNQASDQYSQ
ncbi:heterogeneous nuclear ribonucleoprotein C-like isoform X2 [Mastomys coucha]|uniref:heterogeneous nuclear ribonucleoprotein C-like isoform X2 n=1 Tax=Mastomys coucha TaxID=35658 RepID=UPI001261F34A|nr:heterogeneous nuclear ribonucleoprotein C-like isoform X2 [Mastomys coucha]